MNYLDDFDVNKYHLFSNIQIEERDYMATLSLLCGIPYKMLPRVTNSGGLSSEGYSLWLANGFAEEEYALTNSFLYLSSWRRGYLKEVGVPVDLLFKKDRFGPIGTEKERFPEFADKIGNPLPVPWKEIVTEIDKYKQEYENKNRNNSQEVMETDEIPEGKMQ